MNTLENCTFIREKEDKTVFKSYYMLIAALVAVNKHFMASSLLTVFLQALNVV